MGGGREVRERVEGGEGGGAVVPATKEGAARAAGRGGRALLPARVNRACAAAGKRVVTGARRTKKKTGEDGRPAGAPPRVVRAAGGVVPVPRTRRGGSPCVGKKKKGGRSPCHTKDERGGEGPTAGSHSKDHGGLAVVGHRAGARPIPPPSSGSHLRVHAKRWKLKRKNSEAGRTAAGRSQPNVLPKLTPAPSVAPPIPSPPAHATTQARPRRLPVGR